MKNKAIFIIVASILFTCITANIVFAQFAGGAPGPGDIYKEFTFNHNSNNWRVTDPNATNPGAAPYLPNPILRLGIDDLQGAIHAEIVKDFWTGHVGTINKRFRFNGNPWITIPELHTLGPCPSPGNMYMQQVNHLIEVPLSHLKTGINTFEGTSGPNAWGWGQWGWYGVVVRVYYNSNKPHASGQVTSHSSNSTFSDNPTIAVATSGSVSRVDFLAYYDDHDTDGDGNYLDFHRNYHKGSWSEQIGIKNHVGTDIGAPYQVTWNTQWVPDQVPGRIKLIARIRDNNGYWFVTNAVNNLTLQRTTSSVKIYKATGVPQEFWVRAGRVKSCTVSIPTLSGATAALMKVASWNGNDGSDYFYSKVNNWTMPKYGANHFYSYDQITVPVSALKTGSNIFKISSTTDHHGLEIMWPGPSILVRYGSALPAPPAPPGTAPTITQQPSNVTVSVGQTATFSVTATGTPPLSYQWEKNWVNISGATGPSYTTPPASLSDDGSRFSCRVSNAHGNVTSNNATISVTSSGTAPTITQHPSSVTVSVGQTATFSVTATGTVPLSYQWKKNGDNISGATGPSYTTPPASLSDDGSRFSCRVTNAHGTVTSNQSTLTVGGSPPPPPPPPSPTENITVNPGFEDGTSSWNFYTNGEGNFVVTAPGHESTKAACITTVTGGTNVQLHQHDLSLKSNTDYQLRFSAKSNTGHDMTVSVIKHDSPYTNCGVRSYEADLTTSWKTFTIDFRTPDFGDPVDDARLMFWFAGDATPGDQHWIDNVVLTSGDSPPPPPTGNITVNPGFEDGTSSWNFYTNGEGNFVVTAPGHESTKAACITTVTGGTNVQLHQHDLSLKSNTDYQLRFSAKSNTGHDMTVSVIKHDSPYTNCGVRSYEADLTTSWKTFTIDFRTPDFGDPVDDARLMFWFAGDATPGDQHWIDNVVLTSGD